MSQHASLFHAARRRHSARGGLAGHLLRQATKLHMQLLLLLFITTCSWLALVTHTQPAHASTALSDRLQHLQASYKGHVESTYGVAGGYWVLDTNFSSPSVPLLSKTRYRVTNRTCWEMASSHPETMSQLYRPIRQPPTALPGNVPRAAWQWKGKISRQLFESVPFILRDKPVQGVTCQHCTYVLRYKVLGGQLYVDRSRRQRDLQGAEKEAGILEGLLLAALYMYKVPDVDFLVHLGDGCPAGLPLVQSNINRSNEQAGFTIPMQMWKQALGPEQFAVLAECLEARYPSRPLQQRQQRAVWRGSNTDSRVLLMDETNVLDVVRTRLHMFGRWYPDAVDAHYTGFPQQAFAGNCIGELMPPGPELPLEDFNRYALLLDIDGNAWSDRYRLLAHFNTPVLKQASNLTAFFEHVMAPGTVMEQYAADLSDLLVRARQLLGEVQQQPDRMLRMAEQQQGLAAYLLTQIPLMHAAAYTLAKVAELSSWKPVMQPEYELVPFSSCCSLASNLPRGFVQAAKAWGESLKQQGTTAQVA